MVSTVFLGRSPTAQVTDAGVIGSGTMRAYVTNKSSQSLWLRRIGARIGPNTAGSRTVIFAAYNKGGGDLSAAPRIAQTASFTASTLMVSASEGANEERDVTTPVLVPANSVIALDIVCVSGGTLTHGMVQSANPAIGAQNDRNFYNKSGSSAPTPFGAYSATFEGAMSLWAECHTNDAPHLPVNRTVLNLESLTPQFRADHRDNNGTFAPATDSGDKMAKYQIIVQRSSDSVNFWTPAPFTASSTERANNQLLRTYAGTTLVRGTEYKWAVQTQDDAGAWSGYSSFLAFTPSAQGTVTAEAPPSGKQETTTPGPFTARWTHATGLTMTEARIRIKDQSGTVVRSSALINVTDVAHSAAPGTLFTISWAQSGFTALSPGGSYTYEIQGRDSAANDSAWSNGVAFTVNAAPTVPFNTEPDNSEVKSSLPLITFDMTDPDDTTGTGLIAKVRIKDSAGALLFTRDATFNTSLNRWEYQTTGTDLASFATYKWDAYGFDGTFYSGGAITVEADAVKSPEDTFVYAQGPTVAIVAPVEAGTVDSSTPTFQWTAPDQTAFKLRVYDDVTGVLIRATNGGDWSVSAQQTYTHPSGWLQNGGAYRWEIEIRDANLLTGIATGTFSVVFTPPADVTGFAANPYMVGNDPWATAIRLDWEASADPNFAHYDLYRDDITGPYVRLTSANEVAFIDFTPASGRAFTYTLKVVAQVEDEQISSAGTSAEAVVTIQGVVLSSVTDPATVRFVFDRIMEMDDQLMGVEATYLPWGAILDPAGKPTTVRGQAQYWETTMQANLYGNDVSTALTQRSDLEALAILRHTFCQRDWLGRRRFVVIPADAGLSLMNALKFGRSAVTMRMREENYRDGLQ